MPVELRERIGRRELVRSLGRCDTKTARLLADQLYRESEQLFELARRQPMLSDDQLARLVQGFYHLVLQRERSYRPAGRFISEEQRAAYAQHWRDLAEKTRRSLGANALHDGTLTTIDVARIQGLNWAELDTEERHQCTEAVHRAGIDLANALAARYEGNFNFEPKDKLLTRILRDETEMAPVAPAQARPKASSPPSPSLSQIYPDFIQAQITRGGWSQQTANQSDATYRLFVSICEDRAFAAYSRADAQTFRRALEKMPSDYGKAATYRNLQPSEIIALYQAVRSEDRSPSLAQKTIKRHFSAMSAIWSEAIAGGEATTNIFSDFTFPTAKRASDERQMWQVDELVALFSSPVWTGCINAHRIDPNYGMPSGR